MSVTQHRKPHPLEPGGFRAISRWLRSNATPPPEIGRSGFRIPEGCQPERHGGVHGVPRGGLRSLRDRIPFTFTFRRCRSCLAQPPANGWHPSGMTVGANHEMNFSGMTGHEPGGVRAISRWLRSNATTPPETGRSGFRIPEGCEPERPGDVRDVPRGGLRSLRDRIPFAFTFRRCRYAQPPANRSHPFGMTTAIAEVLTEVKP